MGIGATSLASRPQLSDAGGLYFFSYDVAFESEITPCIKSINHKWFTDLDDVMR